MADWEVESVAPVSSPSSEWEVAETKPVPGFAERAGKEFNQRTAENFDAGGNMASRGVDNVKSALAKLLGGNVSGAELSGLKGVGQAALGGLGMGTAAFDPAVRVLVGNPVEKETGIPAGLTDLAAEIGPGLPSLARSGASLAKKGVQSLAGAEPAAGVEGVINSGYVLPPALQSQKPSFVSDKLSALAGKTQLQQKASAINQGVSNAKAAEELGLSKDTILTPEAYDKVIKSAEAAKNKIISNLPHINMNISDKFLNDMIGIRNAKSETEMQFPDMENKEIGKMVDGLLGRSSYTPQAVMDKIQDLRFDANANYKAVGDPGKLKLAAAQKNAADALESVVEENIQSTNPDLLNQYREQRTLQAKAYNLRDATNATTGDVNAAKIAGLLNKRKPLTGGLKDIANLGSGFSKAAQVPNKFGGVQQNTIGDAALSLLNPKAALGAVARPVAKSVLLSPAYQKAMMGGSEALPTSVADPLSYLGQYPNYVEMLNRNAQTEQKDNP